MRKKINESIPKHDEVIVFKCKETNFPEIGIFQIYEDGLKEIFIPANDDVESLYNVEWWAELPK